jgi:UDP-N-acetylglucosamine:LPS N-acetylglucosamine transferase
VLIEEHDLTVEFLIAEIERMLSDPARLAEMSRAAAHIGERHRSGALVDVIEAVARS